MKTVLNRAWSSFVLTKHKAPRLVPIGNAELIEEFLTWKQSYAKTAHRAYRLWITRFQVFVDKSPEQLSHADYVAFAQSIGKGYAPRCIEFALNVVHNYLRFYSEQGRLTFPMYLVRVPKAASNSHAAITEDEYQQILATMTDCYP